jgi:DNA-binding transcriptional MerR regulator
MMARQPGGEELRPGQYTIRRLAEELGVTPENIRALERRRRLPEGCEPEVDEITGTRYWTEEQVKRLMEWNAERRKDTIDLQPFRESG